jgi:hypothetical protein
MTDLGGASNWNNNDTNFQLVDDGSSGDVSSGDNIFAKSFVNPGITGKSYKAIGLQGSWEYQFGGEGQGYTRNGDNSTMSVTSAVSPIIFQVDATTGRIGVGAALPAAIPTKDAAVSSVGDWQLY